MLVFAAGTVDAMALNPLVALNPIFEARLTFTNARWAGSRTMKSWKATAFAEPAAPIAPTTKWSSDASAHAVPAAVRVHSPVGSRSPMPPIT